jgi:hypothetical protein
LTDLLDEPACAARLEQYLHPAGLVCSRCHGTHRRLFRQHDDFPNCRCRDRQRTYTILTGTVFEQIRQCPATIVPLLRDIAEGETTARLSREPGPDRKRVGELRQQIQTNLYDTLSAEVMTGTAFEADELYQNAGEKGTPHRDVADPPRRRASKSKGKGTDANDRPPIVGLISRTSHGAREFHCNSCEGAGAGLRTFLRPFRGVHKYYLTDYVATCETIVNAKRITPTVVRRMCFGDRLHTRIS